MKRRGYLIYNSKEHLKDRFFQIANMGSLSDSTIDAFLSSLQMVLLQAQKRAAATRVGSHNVKAASEMVGA
jgi:aspartate aminotransferase-like enzyme